MKKYIILIVTIIAFVSANSEFELFIKKYNKVYTSEAEYKKRERIFYENVLRAAEMQKSQSSATFGVTKFSDLTAEEFSAYLSKPNKVVSDTADIDAPQHKYVPNKNNWDWNNVGAVTNVYDQGNCGSGWMYGAVETIESYYFLEGNSLVELSMDQLAACAEDSCSGNDQEGVNAYMQACGVSAAAGYQNVTTCQYNPKDVVTGFSSLTKITGETGIYQQLSAANTGGPVIACVDASSWIFYVSGILTTCTSNIDHCVQVTGYMNYNSGSQPYWVVRNSWGANWGEEGYIYILIGQDLCAIGDDASIPQLVPPPTNPPQSCYQ